MNLLRQILPSTALLGLAALGARAGAQTQSYVQKTKTINAAVLLLDADKPSKTYVYGQTAAPFAFRNLDAAKGIKPDDWNLVNPFAPGFTTHDLYLRYAELGDTTVVDPTANNNVPQPITKSEGAYWTVRLSQLSQSQISSYNLLLIAPRYVLALNTKERELLRRFVDGGGVLWVDLGAASAYELPGNPPVDPVSANSVGTHNLPFAIQGYNGGQSSVYSLGSAPALNALQSVTDADLAALNSVDANPTPTPPSGTTAFRLGAILSQGLSSNDTGLPSEFSRYRTLVVEGGGQSVISQARIGDGAIVVTARGAAEILNRGAAPAAIDFSNAPKNSNLAYEGASPTLDRQGRAAARLAVNIATLGGEGLQPSGSSHKTSAASADTPAPVLSRFNTELPAGSTASGYGDPANFISYNAHPNSPPVTYKGFIVATVGDQIVVMDAVPGRDLDGDGDPDDGISDANGNTVDAYRDVSVGQPLDVIWVSGHLGSTLSAPVCAEVPEAGTIPSGTHQGQSLVDQVLVADSSGTLYVFPLNLSDGASRHRFVGGTHNFLHKVTPPNGFTTVTGALPTSAVAIPTPPVVYDGLAYMVDSAAGALSAPAGGVWVVDLSTGTPVATNNQWTLSASLNLPVPTAEPTIGYIPIADNSGGVDRVMYLPGTVGTAGNTQPAFSSIWLGAKGESPDSVTFDTNGTATITTRAGAAGGLPLYNPSGASSVLEQLAPHISLYDPSGNPHALSEYFSGTPQFNSSPGTILLTGGNQAKFQNDNILLRVDYTIDWGAAQGSGWQQIVRGTLRLPIAKSPTFDPKKRILGPIALTAAGTLHMIEGRPLLAGVPANDPANALTNTDGGDSYFAIREDLARGQFRVVSRYTLYSQYNQTFGGSTAGTFVPAVLNDADAVQYFINPTTAQNTSTTGSQVPFNTFANFRFVGGVALHNGIAMATIDATRASFIPVTMVAAFRAEPDTATLNLGQSIPTNPVLYQTDWARSSPQAAIRTPATSTVSGNSVTVDTDNGILSITNLANVVNGEITDCLSESQPIGVGGSLQTLAFRQPDAVGDRWSPLLWFALWNGSSATGTPFIGNNETFIPATSVLPNLLSNGSLSPSGIVLSVDADAPTSGLYATTLANTNRPWITQQAQLIVPDPSKPAIFSASPYFRMPQNVGIQSRDDFTSRVIQTKLGKSTTIYGLGGGDGIVTAATDTGLFGLSRADLVICDEGRLLEVDSAGNPVKNTFGARFTGIGNGGSVANQVQLPRPVKAYPVGTSDSLVVDAGGNRVMRIGGDGSVLRSLDRIQLDFNHTPAGYRVNEPLTFKDPRDATTFEGYVYKGATDVVTSQQPVEYWIHYLVADSGNGRLVELIDRFAVDSQGNVGAPISLPVPDPETGVVATDGNGGQILTAQVGVLAWQSPSLQGAANVGDYYNSVTRVYLGSTTNGRYVYVAGVSRTRPTSVSAGLDNPQGALSLAAGGGGALVAFDPIGGTRVFDRINMPSLAGATFYDVNNGTFDTNTAANAPAQANRPFRGVQAVTAESVFANNAASVRVMVTDEDAVYEFVIDANTLAANTASPAIQPIWMINEAAYTGLRSSLVGNSTTQYSVTDNPLHFRPTYARRLDSGEVILVNGYQGRMRDVTTTYPGTAYTGEVDLLDGGDIFITASASDSTTRNLGFTFNRVHLGLRTLTGIRGLVAPVFADRR